MSRTGTPTPLLRLSQNGRSGGAPSTVTPNLARDEGAKQSSALQDPPYSASGSSLSTSSDPPSMERLTRSVPGAERHRRRSSHAAPITLVLHDEGECPECGHGREIYTWGYWDAYSADVRLCLFARNGDSRQVCRYAWIDTHQKPKCPCNARLHIEMRRGEFYYVCDTCDSIGFDTLEGGPPNKPTA